MKRMSVISSEFGVGSLERRVSCGFGLLDARSRLPSVTSQHIRRQLKHRVLRGDGSRRLEQCVPVSVSLLALVMLGRVL